jgi:putative transposase
LTSSLAAAVGWRVARELRTELVLDALEQALWSRSDAKGVVHQERPGLLSISRSGTRSGSRKPASSRRWAVSATLTTTRSPESVIGLFKTEVIHHRGPWRHLDEVEYAALVWVDWFNHRRLLEPLGNLPPAEFESMYDHQLDESAAAA